MSKTVLLRGVIVAMGLLTARAEAAILDTGVGPNGSVDTQWDVIQFSGSNGALLTPPNAYIAVPNPPQFPFNGAWAGPLAGSNWIVPTSGGAGVSLDPNTDGLYLYSTIVPFTVTPGQSLSGAFLADNDVKLITLSDLFNPAGTQIIYSGSGEGGYKIPTTFTTGPLIAGDYYKLSFVVDNFAQTTGNPSGLDVSASTALVSQAGVPPVPEASTWAAMILGFLCLGLLGYRRTGSFRFS
jgi:hypothetical protein